MRNKLNLFGIIALITVIGFSMASCASSGGGSSSQASGAGNDGVAKTLVITGIDGFSGDVLVTISSNAQNLTGSMVAVGGAAISGNSVTIPLVLPGQEDQRWTGTGEYYVVLVFEQGGQNVIYFYAQGGMSALRYNISQATTTIAFNQFRRI